MDWEDEWDDHKRVNLGPKLTFGYAIPVGPVKIVPGLEWSMDLLTNGKGDNIPDDYKWRYMNLMGRVAVEFGL